MTFRFLISALVLACVSGCGPSYSPDTYTSNAAQQANKVDQGVIISVRTVGVSTAGTIGSVTGAATGGITGSEVGAGPASAFSALGGSVVGGIAGSTVEHVTGDTTAYEYIVRKPNGNLVSVTQRDKTPLVLGEKVLVIAGTQARVVPDYTVPPPAKVGAAPAEVKPAEAKPSADTKSPVANEPVNAQPAGTTAAPAAAPEAKPALPITGNT